MTTTKTEKRIKCPDCKRKFVTEPDQQNHWRVKHGQVTQHDPETAPDWGRECEVCGQSPVIPMTGLCGPCTFGEADTALGNW